MRMTMVPVLMLCNKHLHMEHHNTHEVSQAIQSRKPITKLAKQGLIEPQNVYQRHQEVMDELERRGFAHNSPMGKVMCKAVGIVDVKQSMAELYESCPECAHRQNLDRDLKQRRAERISDQPEIFFSRNGYTHIPLGEDDDHAYFISTQSGIIDVYKLPKEETRNLRPNFTKVKYAAKVLLESFIEKSERAQRLLELIVNDQPLPPVGQYRKKRPQKLVKEKVVMTQKNPDAIPLKKICAQLDIDPTDARKVLRSEKVSKPGGRWEWPKKEADRITKLLKKAMA